MLQAMSEKAVLSPSIYPVEQRLRIEPESDLASRKSVLVVEDDVDVMMTLKARIEQAGFHAIPAPDGYSALTVAAQKTIDGVILDVNLPGLDGWEVVEQIACPPERVFVISASRDAGFRQRAKRVGCFGFLEKPFTGAYLVDRIRDMINQPLCQGAS